MNNKFDLGRFGQVLALDVRKSIRNFGTSFIVMWCIPVALWLTSLLFNFNMPYVFRMYALFITSYVAIIIAPAKVFGDINMNREGIRFAMLPASILEKFLSYALCCLLVPIVVFAGGYAVDSLLALLPFGGFEDFITSFHVFDAMSSMVGDPNSGVWQTGNDVFALFDSFRKYEIPNVLVGSLFIVGFFMFGNLLFRFRNKAGMSFLILMGFSSIVSSFSRILLISNNGLSLMMEDNGNVEMISQIINKTMLISIIIYSILAIGLYIASYFRMKSLKY